MGSSFSYKLKKNTFINLCVIGLGLLSSHAYSSDVIKQYKGADLIKFDQQVQSEYSLPLANLKKSARTWIPIDSKLVQGDITSSLFKFGRAERLEPIYRFYKDQLLDTASVLYECEGRTCGSSNAWANNYFNDYRLYGADANQSLLVVANEAKSSSDYKVLYLNRRGAGDVMLRIDTIVTHSSDDMADIVFQISLNDKIAIRHYLDTLNIDQSVFVVITSKSGLAPTNAFKIAQQNIDQIKSDLGPALSENITFINFGNQSEAIYGENQLSVLVGSDSAAP